MGLDSGGPQSRQNRDAALSVAASRCVGMTTQQQAADGFVMFRTARTGRRPSLRVQAHLALPSQQIQQCRPGPNIASTAETAALDWVSPGRRADRAGARADDWTADARRLAGEIR